MIKTSVKRCLAAAGTAAVLLGAVAAHAQSGGASTTPTASITAITVFHVKPERADDFMQVMRANIVHSRTEDGNLNFKVFSAKEANALTVYVLETWKDADVLKQHSKQPTLVALHKTFATDLIGHPQSSPVQEVAP